MKLKSMKKGTAYILWTGIFVLMTAMLFFTSIDAQAASARSRALKAYKKMLSQENIDWIENGSYELPLNGAEFGLAYIDKDNIPELVINNPHSSHAIGWGHLYTYKNGKIVLVDGLRLAGDFSYYKKTGVFMDTDLSSGYVTHMFYKMAGTVSKDAGLREFYGSGSMSAFKYIHSYMIKKAGKFVETTKAKYNKKLKKLTVSRKAVLLKFYKNTEENRNKYLR